MKNLKTLLFALITVATTSFASASGSDKLTNENIDRKSKAEVKARVEALTNRIDHVREMDFTEMDGFEKNQLKEELKDIKKELKVAHNGTVTISVGAAIVIVLLLIIIL